MKKPPGFPAAPGPFSWEFLDLSRSFPSLGPGSAGVVRDGGEELVGHLLGHVHGPDAPIERSTGGARGCTHRTGAPHSRHHASRSLAISGFLRTVGRCRSHETLNQATSARSRVFSELVSNTVALMDQARTPYLDALVRYASERNLAFHTPGHIQGRGAHPTLLRTFGPRTLELDLCTGLDNLDGGPDSALAQAEALAAGAY